MFEDSTKLKWPRTANPDDTSTLQTTTTEVPANTEPMLDYIFDDEYASTSTNQDYTIDVPDILEMMDTQYPDPKRNTEEEQNTEETMLISFQPMYFDHCTLEDESPYNQYTYSDCQVTGRNVFDNPYESVIQRHAHIRFIMSTALIIHQIHMERMQSTYLWRNCVRFLRKICNIQSCK